MPHALLPIIALVLAQPAPVELPVRKLSISPMAEPKPALKYELLPAMREKTPGNAALAYFRAFAARPTARPEPAQAEARENETASWLEGPIEKLAVAAARKRLDEYKSVFKELDRAAVSEHCNWELLPRLKTDGVATLLLEVQPIREVSRYLAVRARCELAEGRYHEATRSLQTGLQMAKHVGESPTLINLLVGIALEITYLERVEEWIARPDSPNLYWALTSLPRPAIDPRIGFQGEAIFLEATVPNLAKLRDGVLPKDEAPRVIEGVYADLRKLAGESGEPVVPGTDTFGKLGFAAYVVWQYPAAKKELQGRGRPAKEVETMAGSQVVFLNSLERFLELRDDQWKWVGMPHYQARSALRAGEQRMKQAVKDHSDDLFFRVFAMILPASEKVMMAVARVDRRVALLRTIEAIRLHAAANGGTPPAKLADVTTVPVPDDPITGKPFEYAVTGKVVKLTAPPPEGEKADANNSLRYEITVR